MKYKIEYTTTITQEYQEDIEAKSKEGAIALFEDTHDDASENIEIYRVEETKDKEYSVDVTRTTFYVVVKARDKDEANEKVQKLLEQGSCTNEEDTTRYKVGNDTQVHSN